MPPIQFIATVAGVLNAGTTYDFAVPTTAKPGDKLIAVIACDPGPGARLSGVSAEWFEFAAFDRANATLLFCYHELSSADPGTMSITIDSAITWIIPTLVAYRDMAAAPDQDLSLSMVNVAATTIFPCPSLTLPIYSDLYLGVAIETSANATLTKPANANERYNAATGARRACIFDFLPNATGAIGAKNATTAGAQSGVAASVRLPANGIRAIGKTLSNIAPIPGMLGLPIIGV